MNKLLNILVFVVVFLLSSEFAQAQSAGIWHTEVDSRTGETMQCYQRYEGDQCVWFKSKPVYSNSSPAAVVNNQVYNNQSVQIYQQPVYQQARPQDQVVSAPSAEQPDSIVWQQQHRRYDRRDIDVISRGYRRFPTVVIRQTSERETIATRGTPGFQPQIYVGQGGYRYYYPRF